MRFKAFAFASLVSGVFCKSLEAALHANPSLSTLSSLLDQFELLAPLASHANITILAPTNRAFKALEDWGFNLSAVDPEVARALLKCHVLKDTHLANSFNSKPQFIHSLLQPPILTNVTGGAVVKVSAINDTITAESGLQVAAEVAETNLQFDSGVIHTITSTLVLPHNISLQAVVANLTSFTAALATADLVASVESLADVTFFIPSNEAFDKMGPLLSILTRAQLTRILQYHIVPNTVMYSPNLTETSVATMQGTNLSITLTDAGDTMVNYARISRHDLIVYGGVVHVVDDVLIPRDGEFCRIPDRDLPANDFQT